jgi:hypothetical protein
MTLVAEIMRAHAEVERGSPGAREKLERLQHQYRTGGHPIIRDGGTCQIVDRPSASVSHRPRSISRDVLSYGHPSSAVEIRSRSTEHRPFTVSLTSYSREQILDEIRHIRRQGDLEAAGWMWACQTPRDWSDSLTVALATHAGDSRHGRYSVEVGNPYVLRSEQCPPELRHLKVIGDWHSHVIPGSTTASDTDAKAWAGWMDKYGLARFCAVIVSPAESGGWTYPQFSAWTVRREGHPSLPVCEPARLA